MSRCWTCARTLLRCNRQRLFACNAPPESAYAIADVVCHGVRGGGLENRSGKTSRPHGRSLDLHSAGTPHQIKLEIDIFRRAVCKSLGAHADQAVAQPPLQRSQRLPFQPVERIAVGMSLRNRRARELSSPIIVVAGGAGEIELALAELKQLLAGPQKRRQAFIVLALDWHPARLHSDIGGEGEQLLALERQQRRLLLLRAADVDPLLEIDRTCPRAVEGRIARRHPLHAGVRIAVTIGAGFSCRSLLAVPQRLAVEHPQHGGVGSVVVLHGARIAAHELVARLALGERDFGRHGDAAKPSINKSGSKQPNDDARRHSTAMLRDAVAENPLSPLHSKVTVPLSMAVVKKEKNGLAAIAGNSSARKISSSLYLQMKSVMMSRGNTRPMLSTRKPVSISCWIRALISMISPRLALGGTLMIARAITVSPRRRAR